MTEDDLLRIATSLGLSMDRERARDLLPEVARVLEAAQRLRELPLDATASPFDRAGDERR